MDEHVTTADDLLFEAVVTAFFESVRNQKTVGGKLNSYKLVKTIFISRILFQNKRAQPTESSVWFGRYGVAWFLVLGSS